MKKTDYKEIKLEKGTIFEYSFGEVKLLVYRTNDFIDDEAIMLVKNNKTVVIESPCFNDNIVELEQFIKDRGCCTRLSYGRRHILAECKEICY